MSKLAPPDFSTFDSDQLLSWLGEAGKDPHLYRDGRAGFLRRAAQLRLTIGTAAKKSTEQFKAPPPVEGAPPPPPGIGEMSLKTYNEQREALTGIAAPKPRKTPAS